MSKLMDNVLAKAKELGKHIVLPEGEELRIILAAKSLVERGIAKVTILGREDVIREKAHDALEGINIICPATCPKKDEYAELLFELRKNKGMTIEKAQSMVLDPMYFATLMVKAGDADGMVGGSICATGDVLRPALQIIKTRPNVKTVSSCFIMAMPENSPGMKYGENGVLVFADCAVNPDPNAEQLKEIAIASARSAVQIAGIKTPKVAMLSFSTKGSASHDLVDKVRKATELVHAYAPELDCDGELQADAALVPSVGKLKAPGSNVAGQANILVFPDLQSGNIGYKLVQRFTGAEAVGPICQGFAKPVNDLSRGCSVDDVIGVVAMTALQVD